jgi:hypothetical protein
MDTFFKFLFLPIEPFIMHPERAWLVAGLFGLLFVVSWAGARRFRLKYHVVMLLAVLAWSAFGVMEQQATVHGWNIRVDLLVSAPVILILTIAALWSGFRCVTGAGTSDGERQSLR